MYLESCKKSVVFFCSMHERDSIIEKHTFLLSNRVVLVRDTATDWSMQRPSHISFWNQGTSLPDISRGVAVM